MADSFEHAGIGLRTAIECGDLEDAQKLLLAYGKEVEKCLQSMLGDQSQMKALANDTKKMLDWARGKVSTMRTEALAELDVLHSKQSYLDVGRTGVKSWEMEG